jgi:hypothetical protein
MINLFNKYRPGRRAPRWLAVALLVTATAVGLGVGAQPAHADNLADYCGSNGFCTVGFTSQGILDVSTQYPPGADFPDANFSDPTVTVINNTGNSFCMWSDNNYSGNSYEVHPGTEVASLPSWFGNEIGSFESGQCPTVVGPIEVYEDGQCVDVAGGSASDLINVDQWGCGDDPVWRQWQVFTASGYHQIKSLSNFSGNDGTGFCIGPYKGGTGNGTLVYTYQCDGDPGEQWQLIDSDLLQNKLSGTCLDNKGGSTNQGNDLEIWTCNPNDPNQQFGVPW